MATLPNLHDGFFDGLYLFSDRRASLLVRTVTGERSTIALTDVEALNIRGLRAGNIIFDLVLIEPENLNLKDIERAYDLNGDAEKARLLLRKAQEAGLSGLEINASYGAEGISLFRTFRTLPEHFLSSEG